MNSPRGPPGTSSCPAPRAWDLDEGRQPLHRGAVGATGEERGGSDHRDEREADVQRDLVAVFWERVDDLLAHLGLGLVVEGHLPATRVVLDHARHRREIALL